MGEMRWVCPHQEGAKMRLTYHRSALISILCQAGVLFCLQAIVDKGRASFHAQILQPFEYTQPALK